LIVDRENSQAGFRWWRAGIHTSSWNAQQRECAELCSAPDRGSRSLAPAGDRDRSADHDAKEGELMTRVLLVGYDPNTVDFSDPALPPGMTIEKIRAGIAVALEQFAARGWEAEVGFIRPDETAGPTVERQLASTSYDCVVIGAGVRLPPRRLAIFEAVINAVHKAAPGAAIAFNTRPEDSADAAARWLPVGSQQ
jgi:hypothetical protein